VAIPVTIPKATISMEEGSILRWLINEGESVTRDSLLFELETDKAILEVPAPADGVLLKIMTETGPVRVEEIVGWIGALGESIQPAAVARSAEAASEPFRAPEPVPSPLSRTTSPSTPAARRRAAEIGLDLAGITGSGPGGRITQEDVERAAAGRTVGIEPSIPSLRPRGELARAVTVAWQTVPHIHISRRLEADGIAQASEQLRSRHISLTDLLLFALSRLLPSFPELTQTWNGDRLVPASAMHIAFAVDTENGVVAPVIQDAASLTLDQIGGRRQELAGAARARQIRLADLSGGVFTLTNLGMEGVDFFAPIINSPQISILATGRMIQEPIVQDGSVMVGWRMWANLALDHRVTDGAMGARFLAKLQERMSQLSGMLQFSTEVDSHEIRNFS
jgi:pyruvate dehydrogenase E2 component (dihydrolipoamide acetyltransferase)